MRFYIGVTDNDWFDYLSGINPDEVNFWQPGGQKHFRAVTPGSPFLFKLKSPANVIGGLGFYCSNSIWPLSMAWEVFGRGNGSETFQEFSNKIIKYRSKRNELNSNPNIGCIVLTNPVFFRKKDWIPVPPNWDKNTVQGKSYSTDDQVGHDLWQQVEAVLEEYPFNNQLEGKKSQLILEDQDRRYGESILVKARLGQGAFRSMVTNAYSSRCAITGERTLPALESSHIKPFAESGPHFISNALLLRSDLHKLFDKGYLTVTGDLKVEVSGRIKEEFENGREYYRYHGQALGIIPARSIDKPSGDYIDWHNQHVFKG